MGDAALNHEFAWLDQLGIDAQLHPAQMVDVDMADSSGRSPLTAAGGPQQLFVLGSPQAGGAPLGSTAAAAAQLAAGAAGQGVLQHYSSRHGALARAPADSHIQAAAGGGGGASAVLPPSLQHHHQHHQIVLPSGTAASLEGFSGGGPCFGQGQKAPDPM